jgi:hypothetical protein
MKKIKKDEKAIKIYFKVVYHPMAAFNKLMCLMDLGVGDGGGFYYSTVWTLTLKKPMLCSKVQIEKLRLALIQAAEKCGAEVKEVVYVGKA